MKRLSILFLILGLILCCLTSCVGSSKENSWFSNDKLSECLVTELPIPKNEYVQDKYGDICVYFKDKELEDYAISVYEYLYSQNFKYFGTRGEQKNTLAGVFTTYYFQSANDFSQFISDEGNYVFVFSDGTLDENEEVVFNVLVIYNLETNTLEYGNKEFKYNTLISLRKESETPLSGFYVLPDESETTIVD